MLQQLHCQMLQQLRVALGGSSSSSSSKRSQRIRHAHKARPGRECIVIVVIAVVIACNWFSINFALDCGSVPDQAECVRKAGTPFGLPLRLPSSVSVFLLALWPIRGNTWPNPISACPHLCHQSDCVSASYLAIAHFATHTHTDWGTPTQLQYTVHYATYCKLFAAAIGFAFGSNKTTKLHLQQNEIAIARK